MPIPEIARIAESEGLAVPFGVNRGSGTTVTTYTSDVVHRMVEGTAYFKRDPRAESKLVKVYPNHLGQAVLGFGGAVTQAAAVTWSRLPEAKQRELMDLLFSPRKQAYNLIRIPLMSCDFSEKSYEYGVSRLDRSLSSFKLAQADEELIVPFIKTALTTNPDIQVIASPWSPPGYMKSNHMRKLGGHLVPRHRERWARIMACAVSALRERGVPVTRMTVQNEPAATQIWESCLYTPEEEIAFAVEHLRPALDECGLSDVRILLWDHNKDRILDRADAYREKLAEYGIEHIAADSPVSGFAFHWYTGDHADALRETVLLNPEAEFLMTEMCCGYSTENGNDIHKAEYYAHELIVDMGCGAHGFVDWNLLLDARGGPNHVGNFCNAPIMATADDDDFEVGLESVYLWHMTHFVKRGARRMLVSRASSKVDAVGFVNPEGDKVLVVLNRANVPFNLKLCEGNETATLKMAAHSIATLTW